MTAGKVCKDMTLTRAAHVKIAQHPVAGEAKPGAPMHAVVKQLNLFGELQVSDRRL